MQGDAQAGDGCESLHPVGSLLRGPAEEPIGHVRVYAVPLARKAESILRVFELRRHPVEPDVPERCTQVIRVLRHAVPAGPDEQKVGLIEAGHPGIVSAASVRVKALSLLLHPTYRERMRRAPSNLLGVHSPDSRGVIMAVSVAPSAPSPRLAEPVASPQEVRVVSIPSAHPYVRSVTSAPGVAVLPDPPTAHGPATQWWPPAALDPEWIRKHASEADLLHVHFGTESFSPSHLTACLGAARQVGWPVVFTLHDIEHPQLAEQSAYLAQLDVLVPGADVVLTLTDGAAQQVRERWGRSAIVVPHPALYTSPTLPPVNVPQHGPESDTRRVGVFLKDLRPNVDGLAVVGALDVALDTAFRRGLDAVAEVRMHRHVRDESARDAVRSLVARSERMVLIEHDRLDDGELAAELARLDACVLPYGHGTHSGWLELCWDLAVPLLVPRVGFLAEQHPDTAIFTVEDSGASLASASRPS